VTYGDFCALPGAVRRSQAALGGRRGAFQVTEVAKSSLQGREWRRQVLDDSLDGGHTIQAADLDGDGNDELIAGGRGKPFSTHLYKADDVRGIRWTRATLDEGGMGPAACVVADLNADRRPDVACIGGATLKWYENLGGAGSAPRAVLDSSAATARE